jgi:hypothetical protein
VEGATSWPWRDAIVELLARARLAQPDELPAVVSSAVAPLGVDITIYVVDLEQRTLRPLVEPGKDPPPPLPVNASIAGRVFMTVGAMSIPAAGNRPARLWMPLLDGVERLGVLEIVPGDPRVHLDDPDLRSSCDMFGQLVGHLVATKVPYGDALLRSRRTGRMSEASELLWQLLPPLTFACTRMVISAILEPCYDVGGDGFDYAVDGSTAHFAVFDTAGHDMRSGLGTATVLAATRAARRDGEGLSAMASAADAALTAYLPELRFTTAVLGTLTMDSGILHYVNAGHPPPLLLRRGKVVARLDRGRRLPLGLGASRLDVAEESLEPGDRLLLFTDGVTEARDRSGDMFGETRLIDLSNNTRPPDYRPRRRCGGCVTPHSTTMTAHPPTTPHCCWSSGRRTRPPG